MKRDWLFDPAEAHQFSPYRPVCFAFHSDYSVSPPNNKISRLHHLVTPLPRCLRFTASITVYSTRLAIGGWLDLTEQDSHLLDYPPFVWAHNQNLTAALVGMMDMPVVSAARFKGDVEQRKLAVLKIRLRIQKALTDKILRKIHVWLPLM